MKQSKQMDLAQEQMQPGVITQAGMLGNDERNLIDIIEYDDAVVKRLGLTHKKIAAKLIAIREKGKAQLGLASMISEKLEARVNCARGTLPCPFHHKGLMQKTYVVIKNVESGKEITFTDLNIHMIEEHGFYEGYGSPYRLDPELLVRELDIKI